ncbi:MAG: hypothetical protein GY795_00720 [Desulfobacterales bacterium]|nr:hypothetical protein [Desulfobacterales bacterium]
MCKKFVSVISILLLTMTFSAGAFCSEPQVAPLNPVFVEYVERTASSPDEFGLGEIPSPIPPEIHVPEFLNEGASSGDSKYDMRDPDSNGNDSDSLLTPVRNQNPCGACWTFATYGSLESSLKQSFGFSDSVNDYSEDNLKHLHGFEWGPCSGGNLSMSTAYLARYSGPVSESDDPYDPSETSDYCTDCTPARYVDNSVWMPVRADVNDNAYIKQAILDHGGLYSSFYWNSTYYNGSPDYTYYYSGSSSTNHAIVIVGWDDNKVVSGAPGNGAFIIRNSWASSWGEGGYFYISYYDTTLAFSSLGYFIDEDDDQLKIETIYQYDTLGRTSGMGWGDKVDWGANLFTPDADGQLAAVGFYIASSNMSYEIYIYDDFNGSQFSTLLGSKTGSVQYPGYYTAKLDSSVSIKSGDNFAVVIKFDASNSGYSYPIPLERPVGGYASATANAGESYISNNGTTFSDVTNSYTNTNVCIKAIVSAGTADTAEIHTPAPGSTLTSTTETFAWSDSGSDGYWLWVGTSQGSNEIYNGGHGTNTSATVSGLPSNGGDLYVRLWEKKGDTWQYTSDYSYTAYNDSSSAAEIQSPVSGSTLSSTTVTFIWNDINASLYYLWIGTSAGSNDLHNGDYGTETSAVISGLPDDGTMLYVRLWSKKNGTWKNSVDYVYTACDNCSVLAEIQSPVSGSTLNSTSVTFSWNDAGASRYCLWIGTSVGSNDVYNGNEGTNTSTTISGLPYSGETLYARLWYMLDGTWRYTSDNTYTAHNESSAIATIQNPVSGTVLSSTTETFTWNDTGASQYWLWIGSSNGSNDLFNADMGTNSSHVMSGLPNDGSALFVRLWSKANGSWIFNGDSVYTAAGP